MTARIAAAAFLAASAPALGVAQDLTEIGSVAAANTAILGTPPQLDPRDLQLGTEIVLDERVETSDLGAGQMLFLDQSTLTVWPNSDVVLDRYIYDPEQDTGEIGLTMTRGLLRFIGGRITKTGEASIDTPNGVIGVRGGFVGVRVEADRTLILHVAGQRTTLPDGLVLARSNALAELRADGEAEYLGVADAEALAAFYGQPTGQGDGGARRPITQAADEGVEESGLAGENSDAADPNAPPISTDGSAEFENDDLDQVDQGTDVVDNVADGNNQDTIDRSADFVPLEDQAFAGVRYRTTAADTIDGLVAPTAGVAVLGGNAVPLTEFFVAGATESGASRFRGETADGGFFSIADLAGFGSDDGVATEHDSDFALLQSFQDDQAAQGGAGYALFALDAAAPGGPGLELNVFGRPVEPEVLRSFVPGPSEREIATFDFVSAFPDGRFDAVMGEFAGAFGSDAFTDLIFAGAPGQPLFADPADGTGRMTDSDTAVVLAFFALSGAGADQAGGLGVLSGPLQVTPDGYPALSSDLLVIGKGDASASPTLVRAPFGLVPTATGETIFASPSDGTPAYFLTASGAQYADGDPDFDPDLVSVSRWDGSAETVERFGELRDSIGSGDTIPLDPIDDTVTQVSETRFASTADSRLGPILTGGYATAVGFAREGGLAPPATYLARSEDAGGFRIAAAPESNGVVAELNIEAQSSGAPLEDVSLNFGGVDDSRGVLLDGDNFVLRESAAAGGAITGRQAGIGGVTGRAATDDGQQAVVGALVPAALVGAGDLFGGVAPEGEFLEYGWWAAEFRFGESDAERRDRFADGVWVAGTPSQVSEVLGIPDIVTYEGDTIANVIETGPNGVITYLDAGGFEMEYDFRAQTGDVTLSGILDDSFTGTVNGLSSAGPDGPHFGGGVVGSLNGGGGPLDGVFVDDDLGNPAVGVMGGYTIRGAGPPGIAREATGVFGGEEISRVPAPPDL